MKTFVFRVVVDTEEDIFRDIEICENQNFEELHDAIVHAFDFNGDQMASFYLSDDSWEKGKEIGLMDVSQFDGDDSNPSMKKTLIGSEVFAKNQKLLYVYDFLKMWIFYVEVIQINTESPNLTYPAIVREFGESPNENDKEIPDMFDGIGADFSSKNEFGDFDDDDDDDFDDDDPFGDFEDGLDDGYGGYDTEY